MVNQSAFESTSFAIASNKAIYFDLTNQLNNYNEIYNMNKYVSDVNKSELSKISSFNDSLNTQNLKLKQQYLLKDYAINNRKFWINIMLFTIIMSGIALCIIAFYSINSDIPNFFLTLNLTIGAIIVIGIIYLLTILILLSTNLIRRKYSWDQYYWKTMAQK
jgi:hypothetical protein